MLQIDNLPVPNWHTSLWRDEEEYGSPIEGRALSSVPRNKQINQEQRIHLEWEHCEDTISIPKEEQLKTIFLSLATPVLIISISNKSGIQHSNKQTINSFIYATRKVEQINSNMAKAKKIVEEATLSK